MLIWRKTYIMTIQKGGVGMTNRRREKDLEKIKCNEKIAHNLKILIDERGMSPNKLCDKIREKNGVSVDRSTLSKFLSHPDEHNISISFLVSCAEVLGVTLDYLVKNEDGVEKSLLAIDSMSEDIEKSKVYFVSDPHNPFWEQYLQEYYCYYYSTVSAENKGDDSLIKGKLKLSKAAEWCRAELKIDTKRKDRDGKTIYKKYVGVAILCQATGTIQCNMRDDSIGECCYLIFRYAQINFTKQACRIAEVLSTSSKPEKRYPVVHRMVLSKEEIEEDDWKLLKSHLLLNYSQISIKEKELELLGKENDVYGKIVEEIRKNDCEKVRMIKERKLREILEKQKWQEGEIAKFISEVRYRSEAYRYNKVSPRGDANLWNVLSASGYYKDS